MNFGTIYRNGNDLRRLPGPRGESRERRVGGGPRDRIAADPFHDSGRGSNAGVRDICRAECGLRCGAKKRIRRAGTSGNDRAFSGRRGCPPGSGDAEASSPVEAVHRSAFGAHVHHHGPQYAELAGAGFSESQSHRTGDFADAAGPDHHDHQPGLLPLRLQIPAARSTQHGHSGGPGLRRILSMVPVHPAEDDLYGHRRHG